MLTDISVAKLQFVRRTLAEEGKEYTPSEVETVVATLCCKLRDEMRQRGMLENKIPTSDTALMEMLQW